MKQKTILTALLICILIISGCGYVRYQDSLPTVDNISEEIKKELGEYYFFRTRKETDDGTILYYYRTLTFDAGIIKDFSDICNEMLPEDKKVSFCVDFKLPGGGAPLFYLKNFNDDGDIYDGLYYLQIIDQSRYMDEAGDPAIYSQIVEIKELHVDKAMQDKADDMGIDWYSYWPDLEKVVVDK